MANSENRRKRGQAREQEVVRVDRFPLADGDGVFEELPHRIGYRLGLRGFERGKILTQKRH